MPHFLKLSYELVGAGAAKEVGGAAAPPPHVFQALQYLRKVCNHPALAVPPTHPRFPALVAQLKTRGTHLRDIAVEIFCVAEI
jgi:hypothetical protein